MIQQFADTSFFLALLNPADQFHDHARRASASLRGSILVTTYIVSELGNALSQPALGPLFLSTWRRFQTDTDIEYIQANSVLFNEGIQLFESRPDKEWSLTDCISFVVMQKHGLRDALTTDRHFVQAGFNAVLLNQTP